MLASYESLLFCFLSSFQLMHPGNQQWWPKYLAYHHPHGRVWWCFWLVASPWLSCDCHRHFRNEQMADLSPSISLSLPHSVSVPNSLSAFQYVNVVQKVDGNAVIMRNTFMLRKQYTDFSNYFCIKVSINEYRFHISMRALKYYVRFSPHVTQFSSQLFYLKYYETDC